MDSNSISKINKKNYVETANHYPQLFASTITNVINYLNTVFLLFMLAFKSDIYAQTKHDPL